MAMMVMHNAGAQLSLGELNRSINKLGKALTIVASGQKINSSKDDAASFAISEVMREKIRSLEQDVENVQNGSAMLKTAEGGIQEQIEILKTIREKAIDAANDSNSDEDRRIIQKELNQLYDQMEQIAYHTDYNSKKVLIGDTVNIADTILVPTLETITHMIYETDTGLSGALNIVDDVYKTLDGLTAGPFDTFKDYAIEETSIKTLGLNPDVTISSGDYNATPYETAYRNSGSTAKISVWDNAADQFMNNRGFYTRITNSDTGVSSVGGYYVLTNNPGTNVYSHQNVKEIDISGCTTVAQVMALIDEELADVKDHSGNRLTIDKSCRLYGLMEDTPIEPTTSSSGPFSSQLNFSGAVYANRWQAGSSGNDQQIAGRWVADYSQISPGTASGSFNINTVEHNSGFTIFNGNGGALAYVRFVDGPLYSDANSETQVVHQFGDDGIINVSKDYFVQHPTESINIRPYNGSYASYGYDDNEYNYFYTGSISVAITANNVSLSVSPTGGTAGERSSDPGFNNANAINQYYVGNGISAGSGSNNVRVRPLSFDRQSSDATFDLSKYQTTDSLSLEKFIEDLAGKALKDNSYNNGYLDERDYNSRYYTNSTNGYYYSFIDSANSDTMINRSLIVSPTTVIDLNQLRNMVGTLDDNGRERTIADAFAELFDNRTLYNETVDSSQVTRHRVTAHYNTDGDETSGVRALTLQARSVASADTTITAVKGVLRHYDLNFNKWFDTEEAQSLVEYDLVNEYLDGKGFRTFCATDNTEWFNFIFRDGKENFKDESFDVGANIHTIQIDVSEIKSAEDLAQAIYEQAEPELKKINHYFHMEIESSGVLRVYDDRPYTNYYFRSQSSYADFQKGDGTDMKDNEVIGAQTPNGGGAKIADGIIEKDGEREVIEKELSFYEQLVPRTFVRELQIQDTTKSSMNIRVRIPQMTLSNIFYPLPDKSKQHVQDYDVITKENRGALLGDPKADPPVVGILDRGMEYLLEANTLVGAQLARLDFTEANIDRTLENTQAADSTLRDADMAKAMTEYTKNNVLAQASQSMLAQANQNLSGVLSLLQ